MANNKKKKYRCEMCVSSNGMRINLSWGELVSLIKSVERINISRNPGTCSPPSRKSLLDLQYKIGFFCFLKQVFGKCLHEFYINLKICFYLVKNCSPSIFMVGRLTPNARAYATGYRSIWVIEMI